MIGLRAMQLPALLAQGRREVADSRAERERTGAIPALDACSGAPVLVLDDDEDVARATCGYVRHVGLPCIRVSHTLSDAFAVLSAGPVRAAIVDWSLPDGTSALLVETLRNLGVPTVVLSGSMPADVEEVEGVPRFMKGSDMGLLRLWLQRLAAGEAPLDPRELERRSGERRSAGAA